MVWNSGRICDSVQKYSYRELSGSLFFYLDAPGSGKYFPIDDYAYIGVGLLEIEGVSVEMERNLQRLFYIPDFLR